MWEPFPISQEKISPEMWRLAAAQVEQGNTPLYGQQEL